MTETVTHFKMILTDQWDQATRIVVGEIGIAYAQLEHVLWLGPKRIKGLTIQVWDAIAERRTIPDRCREILQHYEHKHMHQDREASLNGLMTRVLKAADARNSIFHGRWGCKKQQGAIVSRHRYWRNKDRGVDTQRLIALRDEIRTLRDELLHFPW
jgi:hypothetical protein